jgi:hypothetical protein
MKNNKFFRILLVALLILAPSSLVGVGLGFILNIPWWTIAMSLIGIQWYFTYWLDKHKHTKLIKDALTKYESLDYKKYRIPLTCQECGRENNVELDLTNTEFTCKFCERKNAIYINFSTASITEPLMDLKDVIANAT